MVALSAVIASNQRIASSLPSGLVAVFVGGTSGVGEYTLKALAQYARDPQIYIVGRSQVSADRIIAECKIISPGGHFEFLPADVSVLKGVDDICKVIAKKAPVINILFLSQGSMAFDSITSDGIPLSFELGIHSRLRVILNLLPNVQRAQGLRRVVNVGAATCEGPIDLSNIHGTGFPLLKWRDQLASVTTLFLQEAHRRASEVSFVGTVPGTVDSGIRRDLKLNFRLAIIVGISNILKPWLNVPPAQCGERHVFAATSAAFTASGDNYGVPVGGDVAVALGVDGASGSGVYSTGVQNDAAPAKVVDILRQFKEDGTADKVWNHLMSDFKRITQSEIGLV
ncbi:putative short-chain dehydrogenases/reductase [Xylariaceae sp. FL0255]|nr:putative short-chain dehydrogenases/reductase [Xylariaceae sp. FL0255]